MEIPIPDGWGLKETIMFLGHLQLFSLDLRKNLKKKLDMKCYIPILALSKNDSQLVSIFDEIKLLQSLFFFSIKFGKNYDHFENLVLVHS